MIAATAVLLTLAPALTLLADTSRISAAKAHYEKSMASAKKDHINAKRAWPKAYLIDLTALQKAQQAKGDLNAWRAIGEESKRFTAKKTITDGDIVSEPRALAALQKTYRGKLAEFDTRKSKAITDLSSRYLTFLEAMQKNFVKSGKMTEATVVDTEIKRVEGSADVMAARFSVASTASAPSPNRPKKKPSPRHVTPPVTPKTLGAIPEPDASGMIMYSPGRRPPSVRGETFKPTVLRATGQAGLGGSVSCKMYLCKDGSSTRRNYYSSYSRYYYGRSSSDTSEIVVRLALRFAKGGESMKGLTVVVQHFGRSVSSGDAGSVEQVNSLKFRMDELGMSGQYVDCPPISFSRSETYYGRKSGNKFNGVLVSVFDDSKDLIYQGASNTAVAKFGNTAARQ